MTTSPNPDCLFCKIVSGAIPSTRVYEDADVFAFRDIQPAAPTHVLIVPRQHFASIAAMSETDAPLIARLFLTANQIAVSEHIEQRGYRLVVNTGEHGGQSVSHVHVHLLGGRALGWPPG